MRNGFATMALVLLTLAAVGCGDDDGKAARVIPTPPPDEHFEILVGSAEENAGELVIGEEFEGTIEVPFDQCLGGSGEECTGGTRLYVATSPGFESLEESQPDEDFYALAEDTLVRLTLVSAPAGVTLKFDNTKLDQTGEIAILGNVPFHSDVEWQIAVASGASVPHHVNVTVRLTTNSAAYATSEDIELRLEPVAEHDHE